MPPRDDHPGLGVGFASQISFLAGLSVLDGLSTPGTQAEQVAIVQLDAPFMFLPTDPDNWTDILHNMSFELSADDTAVIHTRIVVVPEPGTWALLWWCGLIVTGRRRGRRVSMKKAAAAPTYQRPTANGQ